MPKDTTAADTAVGAALGQKVRRAREDAALTQAELAERAEIGGNTGSSRQSAISRIEARGELSTYQLERIAIATGKSVNYFLASDLDAPGSVWLRAGDAEVPEVKAAFERWSRLIDDYEFLRSLPE